MASGVWLKTEGKTRGIAHTAASTSLQSTQQLLRPCTSYVQVTTTATCTLTSNLNAMSATAYLAPRLLRLRWLLLCQAC